MKHCKNKPKPQDNPVRLLKNPEVTEKQFMDARNWYLTAQIKEPPRKNQ